MQATLVERVRLYREQKLPKREGCMKREKETGAGEKTLQKKERLECAGGGRLLSNIA